MTASEIVRQIFQAMLDRLTAAEEELGKLDAAAGDGDHGTGMTRGLRAAVTALESAPVDATVPHLFMQAGSAFADAAGGLHSKPCGAQRLHMKMKYLAKIRVSLAQGKGTCCK